MNRGVVFALGCYIAWGFLAIYWKALSAIPGMETTSHRIVWAAVAVALVLTFQRNWQWLGPTLRQPRLMLTLLATSALIFANWSIYIYAVNTNRIVESSLGYFINPLVNVLLGVIFLRERPRIWQWLAIGIASAGVIYLAFDYGNLPWVALSLAFSFGFYGLLKKQATLPTVEGLFMETIILAIPLAIYLFALELRGVGTFGHTTWQTNALLMLAGVVTSVPLLLFSAGARRVPMTVLGILQYISPTIQFVIGIALYREPFSQSQLVGFGFIWVALLLFTVESSIERHRLHLAMRPH